MGSETRNDFDCCFRYFTCEGEGYFKPFQMA